MNKKYTVFFEVFGRKMKHTVYAKTETDAKNKILSRIVWHKVEAEQNSDELFNTLFGTLNKK